MTAYAEHPKVADQGGGYDSAVHSREDDHLNRWLFAKEVYGVATTGPREWSVRIGVYGEWGTGKTSVLNFVDSLAQNDGHIVVRFNPWEYSSKKDLWHAFVQAVVASLPAEAHATWAARRSWMKKLLAPIARFISQHGNRLGEVVNDKRVTLGVIGIDLLKDFVFSNRKDLGAALSDLGGKRLIILVDDLDRTSPALVPEMLFALKEIMDVGGFAFICAFDPDVVGQVLGDYHKGFGDGLYFLEKIIDYPRWLPPVTSDAVAELALLETANCCPYVPADNIKAAVPLLPDNPRAVRKFIRLLALLKPQIERHRPDELNWPIILASNVIKIRFPQLAAPLLEDQKFWQNVYGVSLMREEDSDKKLRELVLQHLTSVSTTEGIKLSDLEQEQATAAMLDLAGRLDAWIGIAEKEMLYQLRIAEAPAAVTWKEYDAFADACRTFCTRSTAESWIKQHAVNGGRLENDIYRELYSLTVRARQSALGRAADVIGEDQMKPLHDQAEMLLSILIALSFNEQDGIDERLMASDFEKVLKSFMQYIGWDTTETYKAFRISEISYLKKLVSGWREDLNDLFNVLRPHGDTIHLGFDGEVPRKLHQKLCSILTPRYALQLLDQFHTDGFVNDVIKHRGRWQAARDMLLDSEGAFWKGLREEIIGLLGKANEIPAVHQNAYQLLSWFDYMMRSESGLQEKQMVERLMKESNIGLAIWSAATAQPLNPRAVDSLKELPGRLTVLGLEIELPYWWQQTLIGLENKEADKGAMPESNRSNESDNYPACQGSKDFPNHE